MIAQLGERQTEDLKVPGSIPGRGIFLFSNFFPNFSIPSQKGTTFSRFILSKTMPSRSIAKIQWGILLISLPYLLQADVLPYREL